MDPCEFVKCNSMGGAKLDTRDLESGGDGSSGVRNQRHGRSVG
jgi:hypothetical protein